MLEQNSVKNNSSKYNHLKMFTIFVTQVNTNIVKMFTIMAILKSREHLNELLMKQKNSNENNL